MERTVGFGSRDDRREGMPSDGGFTLIELLVVIAIIALLVSILLPSITKAKELARSAVCRAHLRGVGIAFHTYASDNDDRIPGPNTTGYVYLKPGRPPSGDGDRSLPMSVDDWMSPTLGNQLGLSRNRNDRLVKLLNTDLRCPSNNEMYDYAYPNGNGWPNPKEIRYSSYSAPLTLHVYADAQHAYNSGQEYGLAFSGNDVGAVDVRSARHKFRVETLGISSLKVVAMDGARYVDDSGRISFNTDTGSAWGGNFMNRGPSLNVYYQGSGNPYKYASNGKDLHANSRKYSYRHDGKLNMVFFDGHTASMSHEESRAVEFWYPTKSVVTNPNLTGDKNARAGDVVR